MEVFWNERVMMVEQVCEYTKTHRIVYVNRVNLIVCGFISIELLFNRKTSKPQAIQPQDSCVAIPEPSYGCSPSASGILLSLLTLTLLFLKRALSSNLLSEIRKLRQTYTEELGACK